MAPRSFLAVFLPEKRELGDGAGGGGLGALAAGVGVNLGIVHHDVDVLARGQHVVDAAEGDVVSRAVAAEYPVGFLGEQVGHGVDFGQQRVVLESGQQGLEPVAVFSGASGILHVGQPAGKGLFDGVVDIGGQGLPGQWAR
jgi:hypothetical protein